MQYCSLQHWTLLPSPIIATNGDCFCFGSASSFFLELFLHFCPVAYWAPTDLKSPSFSVISFCLFILFMGFSRQKYSSGLPFFSPVDQVLSELFTMTHLSWVALGGMAHRRTRDQNVEEPEIKLPISVETQKKQGNSWKKSTTASLTTQKLLTVWITTDCWKFFKRWEY